MSNTETVPPFLSNTEMRRRAGDLAELITIRESLDRQPMVDPTELQRADAAIVDAELMVADAIQRRQEHREATAATP